MGEDGDKLEETFPEAVELEQVTFWERLSAGLIDGDWEEA